VGRPGAPETVIQQVTNAAAVCEGYSFQPTAANSVVLTRKYWPVWVIVVAAVGALFCLIGLLALLYKETETMTVTATDSPTGPGSTSSAPAAPRRWGASTRRSPPSPAPPRPGPRLRDRSPSARARPGRAHPAPARRPRGRAGPPRARDHRGGLVSGSVGPSRAALLERHGLDRAHQRPRDARHRHHLVARGPCAGSPNPGRRADPPVQCSS